MDKKQNLKEVLDLRSGGIRPNLTRVLDDQCHKLAVDYRNSY